MQGCQTLHLSCHSCGTSSCQACVCCAGSDPGPLPQAEQQGAPSRSAGSLPMHTRWPPAAAWCHCLLSNLASQTLTGASPETACRSQLPASMPGMPGMSASTWRVYSGARCSAELLFVWHVMSSTDMGCACSSLSLGAGIQSHIDRLRFAETTAPMGPGYGAPHSTHMHRAGL